mmetsp:Transcript_53670/g.107594  ORF Transcript_53670/g.107594 Transcript_53670/m.107594 type:complete len:232 (+) Transcript_53670:396-1091(+)
MRSKQIRLQRHLHQRPDIGAEPAAADEETFALQPRPQLLTLRQAEAEAQTWTGQLAEGTDGGHAVWRVRVQRRHRRGRHIAPVQKLINFVGKQHDVLLATDVDKLPSPLHWHSTTRRVVVAWNDIDATDSTLAVLTDSSLKPVRGHAELVGFNSNGLVAFRFEDGFCVIVRRRFHQDHSRRQIGDACRECKRSPGESEKLGRLHRLHIAPCNRFHFTVVQTRQQLQQARPP